MKKITLMITLISSLGFSQINTVILPKAEIFGQNPFFDASSYSVYGSEGKGLYFPQTDLSQFQFDLSRADGFSFFTTYFDGMLVYNTATEGSTNDPALKTQTTGLKRGFYYFSNPEGNSENKVSKGKWVRIADGNEAMAGVNSGKFWTLKGNSGTDAAVDYLGTTDAQNLVMKVNVDKEGLDGLEGADDYNPTKLILGNAVDAPAFTKVVIGGTPQEQEAALATRIKNVQPDGQKEAADFKFVLEVFGKARFANGLVTSASTYPDYVFDNYFTGKSDVNPDYKFKKLNEVEAFIKENNHLPGVTKIDDLAKTESGYEVDNTQLSIQTLEKVEELYLHLIEQQKEIQALKAQIAELKK